MWLKQKENVCTIQISRGFLFCICKQTEIINKTYFWLYSELKITDILTDKTEGDKVN